MYLHRSILRADCLTLVAEEQQTMGREDLRRLRRYRRLPSDKQTLSGIGLFGPPKKALRVRS